MKFSIFNLSRSRFFRRFSIYDFYEKKSRQFHASKSGFGVLEVLIGSAIISFLLISLAGAGSLSSRVTHESLLRKEALLLTEEGLEAVRFLRDESWSTNIQNRAVEIAYYPVFNEVTRAWSLTENPSTVLNFTRRVIFSDVYRRNSDDDIVPATDGASKTLDPETRKVTAAVLWEGGRSEVSTYITDLFNN